MTLKDYLNSSLCANLDKVRSGLWRVQMGEFDKVKLDCFNKSEADEVRKHLTEEERSKVLFSWIFS